MATLKYQQFLERNKISEAWQDRRKVYSICTAVFPNIPDEAHEIPWSLRNMEPSFMNFHKVFDSDESRNQTSNVAITFKYDGPNFLAPEHVYTGKEDPYTPCRDLNIRTKHYNVYNFELNKYINNKIPQGSNIKEIGACNDGGEYDNIYTFTAALASPSYIDVICKDVYKFITQIGFSKINHIIIDTLSDNSYKMMTSLLIASHYDHNAKETEEEEDDWCWHSISSVIKHWSPDYNEIVHVEEYNQELNSLCSAYDAINGTVHRFGIEPYVHELHCCMC